MNSFSAILSKTTMGPKQGFRIKFIKSVEFPKQWGYYTKKELGSRTEEENLRINSKGNPWSGNMEFPFCHKICLKSERSDTNWKK